MLLFLRAKCNKEEYKTDPMTLMNMYRAGISIKGNILLSLHNIILSIAFFPVLRDGKRRKGMGRKWMVFIGRGKGEGEEKDQDKGRGGGRRRR